jgi:DNA-binding NarL/FixJ family response regulator
MSADSSIVEEVRRRRCEISERYSNDLRAYCEHLRAVEAQYSSRLVDQVAVVRSSRDVPLTQRETQVLRHVALGLSNDEIGCSLEISIETVQEHVQNILRKLAVSDRTQAAVRPVGKESR